MVEGKSGLEEQHSPNAQGQKQLAEAARKGRVAMRELGLKGEAGTKPQSRLWPLCPVSMASGLQWGHLLACLRLPGILKETLPFLEASVEGWGASVFLVLKET